MHAAALAFLAAHLPRTTTSVLEFGSRNINGSARTITPPDCYYVGVDIEKGFGVDIVANAATVTVGGRPFDIVICAEVFEHTDDETCAEICFNALTHLTPDGMFVATMAGLGRTPHSAADGGPVRPGEFYRNVDRALLESWLTGAGFDRWDVDVKEDDIRCWARK